jgi:hypothetical protein
MGRGLRGRDNGADVTSVTLLVYNISLIKIITTNPPPYRIYSNKNFILKIT